jgi:hypothetical protein
MVGGSSAPAGTASDIVTDTATIIANLLIIIVILGRIFSRR